MQVNQKIESFIRSSGIIHAQFEDGEIIDIPNDYFYEYLKGIDCLDIEYSYPTEYGEYIGDKKMDLDQYFDNYSEDDILLDLNGYVEIERNQRKAKKALSAMNTFFNLFKK